jgi:hypothetical protein
MDTWSRVAETVRSGFGIVEPRKRIVNLMLPTVTANLVRSIKGAGASERG